MCTNPVYTQLVMTSTALRSQRVHNASPTLMSYQLHVLLRTPGFTILSNSEKTGSHHPPPLCLFVQSQDTLQQFQTCYLYSHEKNHFQSECSVNAWFTLWLVLQFPVTARLPGFPGPAPFLLAPFSHAFSVTQLDSSVTVCIYSETPKLLGDF